MRICSLSSGSKGNSIFIESEHARILLDIGLSAKQISERLCSIQVDPETIDAIVLTHAHRDHTRGVGVFSRQFKTPVYGHSDTLTEISYLFKKQEVRIPWLQPFTIKDLFFTPFKVSHDSIPTVGYLISNGSRKLAVCTDLGIVTQEVESRLSEAQFLVLESNHDPDMLLRGPYPWELKERISGRLGHISNHEAGSLLQNILNGRIEKILLAHLSDENNTSDLARNTVLEYMGYQCSDLLEVIHQKKVSPVYEF
ncbi:MAG: MBL fold metallo-hydrolase [Calditrichia bacterium]